ncbi:MAG: exodeoxyribonuclease VII large subunit [candidate division SR1 bacterium]|nr:exodeoxyribonuclease VII large subunit [candidate division SR1 bacterium]
MSNTSNLFQEEHSIDLADQKVADINDKLNWIITHKDKSELLGILDLNKHKSVSVRRKLAELIANLGDEKEIEYLINWQNQESDRKTWLSIESAIDRIQRRKNGDDSDVKALTVTEALGLIKSLVSEKIYIVEGEVTEVNTSGQMYYFNIKDSEQSVLSCWCFAGIIYRSDFTLNEGLSIRIAGKFKISSKSSKLYFDVQKLELTGEGEFLRNLQLLEEKLRNEGMMDVDRKRKIPILPQNILLIASSNSAALTDYIKVIKQRRQGLTIYHLPIKTQGVGVEGEILEKFAMVNDICDNYDIDTVVITRGGGSKEDLIVFNSERVTRAIHTIKKPTIVAIGHERDTSLSELVADKRASTPSQAAEISSLSSSEVSYQINNITHILTAYFREKKYAYQRFTDQICILLVVILRQEITKKTRLAKEIDQSVTSLMYTIRIENNKLADNIKSLIKNRIFQAKYFVGGITNLESFSLQKIVQYKYLSQSLYINATGIVSHKIETTKQQASVLLVKIELENPQNIMKKGYAIIKNNSSILNSTKNMKTGDLLKVEMIDGSKNVMVQ